MIKLILLLIWVSFAVISTIWRAKLLKSNHLTSWNNIKKSLICYSCYANLFETEEEYFAKAFGKKSENLFSLKVNKLSLCKSCNRDSKISYLQGKKNWKLNFKEFLLSEWVEKTIFILFISVLLIPFAFFDFPIINNVISYINYTIYTFYWGLNLTQTYYISKIPLEKESRGI